MSIGAAGSVGGSGNVNPAQANQVQVRDAVRLLGEALQDLKGQISELSQEFRGEGKQRSARESGPEVGTQATVRDTPKDMRGTVQFRPQDQAAQNQQHGKADHAAEAAAGLMVDDDDKKKRDKKTSKFEDKMARLSAMKSMLEGVELSNKEDQEALEEFLENMGRLQTMQERLKQLEYQEKKYEDLLREQDARGESKDSKPAPTPVSPESLTHGSNFVQARRVDPSQIIAQREIESETGTQPEAEPNDGEETV